MKRKVIFSILLLFVFICDGNSYPFRDSIDFAVQDDGTFDILGTSIQLTNCYPGLENQSVKPLKTMIDKSKDNTKIKYHLSDSYIEIGIKKRDNTIIIDTYVESKTEKFGVISPIHNATVNGVEKIYRTSGRFMGNGGIKQWPVENAEISKCETLTGLLDSNGNTLTVSSRDFSKYMTFSNCLPTNYNNGQHLINISIATEKVSHNSLPSIYITEGQDAFKTMQKEAKEIANSSNALVDKPLSYHWCSWYYAYYHLTETMLADFIEGFNTVNPRVPIQTIQIDAGYFPSLGDWLDPSWKFPDGIQNSIQNILNNNYRAGIWIGPYMVGNRSRLYREHPDWVLKKLDGTPVINMAMYGEHRLWGLMDEELYTLDTSNPEAMEYLRQVFRSFRKMGITFFKTDFMLWGNIQSDKVKRFHPGKTSLEYQHEFFKMIREEIGGDSFWLGCIAPFAPMIGYADGMRISSDIRPSWEGGENMFVESIGAQHINNIWWQNDPDAIILREKYNHQTDAEAKSLIMWMGMLGGMINTSDLFHEIPEERLELFRFLEPGNSKFTNTMPFINSSDGFEVIVREYPETKSWAALFVNRQKERKSINYSIPELTGIKNMNCFEWDVYGSKALGNLENILIDLNAHESKLIYFSVDNKSPEIRRIGSLKDN